MILSKLLCLVMTQTYNVVTVFLTLKTTSIYIYILSVVALDEITISSCYHFWMQNIEMACDLDRTSRWSYVNVSE